MTIIRQTVLLTAALLSLSETLLMGAESGWKSVEGHMMTRWAKDVSPDNVHPEYPRPQMVRKDWTNLNGLWDYAIRPVGEENAPGEFDGQILVPFPLESALSGVMKRLAPDQRLWYRRTIEVAKPAHGGGVLLHFGAVDWQCEVFVNGKSVGKHTGGYDPFTFDVSNALKANTSEQEVVVSVSDPTDANWQPRGKQVRDPKGIWYTPTSGIWQTVWLEVVPASYLRMIAPTPRVEDKMVFIGYDAVNARDGILKAVVRDGDKVVAQGQSKVGLPLELPIPSPKLWSPASPHLYDLTVTLLVDGRPVDEVTSYFGMRKIALGKDKDGITRIMLNGEPLFQYGPLDQGFWPDGLYTAPTDAALKYDLEVTKKLGFNMVRKHVKVEPARWYYHCDRMGLLVWQDMPSGDKHAPWRPTGEHDGEEIQRSQESAENFKDEWREIIHDLRHFPSIVVWVPFNEAWGQFNTVAITKLTEQLDPTRLVNPASGGNDFPVGHIYDLHRYPGPVIPKLEENRAAVLGEYGGLGLPLEGHTWQAKDNWGYRSFTSKEALANTYAGLIYKLRPLIGQGLAAAIYTQTTDVEVEVNGLMTYDREVIKFDADELQKLHATLYRPAPGSRILLATSEHDPQQWAYSMTQPPSGWQAAGFDAGGWTRGPAPFQGGGQSLIPSGSTWTGARVWLRRTFDAERAPQNLWLETYNAV
jgi:hypothetical protein